MKPLFSIFALSRKPHTSLLFPYSLIFCIIREIREAGGGAFLTAKGTFKNKGFVVDVLRAIQFILRNRSIDIFSLTGNLRKPHLSVRTFLSIEKATLKFARTFTWITPREAPGKKENLINFIVLLSIILITF